MCQNFLLRNSIVSRRFCSYNVPIIPSEFYTTNRKTLVNERVQKFAKAHQSSPRVVNEKNAASLNQAAVLVPLVSVNKIPGLLYTVRSSSLRIHGGEISFPGGKCDSKLDSSAKDTALRETEEELGIPKQCFEVWAQLPLLKGKSGETVVTPIVALLKDPLVLSSLRPNADEVSKVIFSPVSDLCQKRHQAFTQFRAGYTLPVYSGQDNNENYRIWGLTAVITHWTLSVLVPEFYELKLPFIKNIYHDMVKRKTRV